MANPQGWPGSSREPTAEGKRLTLTPYTQTHTLALNLSSTQTQKSLTITQAHTESLIHTCTQTFPLSLTLKHR